MFIAALFAAPKVGSNPTSTNRGLNKQNMPYTCKRILFRLKEDGNFAIFNKWMNLENIMTNEIS